MQAPVRDHRKLLPGIMLVHPRALRTYQVLCTKSNNPFQLFVVITYQVPGTVRTFAEYGVPSER